MAEDDDEYVIHVSLFAAPASYRTQVFVAICDAVAEAWPRADVSGSPAITSECRGIDPGPQP